MCCVLLLVCKEAAVPECREEEGADGEAAGGAGGVHIPQDAQTGRAGWPRLWLPGLEVRPGGDRRSDFPIGAVQCVTYRTYIHTYIRPFSVLKHVFYIVSFL